MAESEVIVIGGGIAGASTAWRLAEHGRSVTLLERGEIASEASGVNAGGIGAYGWGHVPNLEAYLTMGSLQIFRSLQLDLGYDIEFRTAGALQAIQTPEQFEYSRDNVLSLKSRGYTVDLLNVDEARSIEPELDPELKGVVHFPLRAQADPVKATRAFALAARDLGANVLTGREVTGISSGPDAALGISIVQARSILPGNWYWRRGAGASNWAVCSGCRYQSCQFAARCGRPNPCLPGCFTLYRRRNRRCTGA